MQSAGKTESGNAGEQPARNNRLGSDGYNIGEALKLPHPF